MTHKTLKNKTILVTRPKHQAEPFCQMLEQAGAKVVRFPAIEIIPIPFDNKKCKPADQQDIIIFTSRNAVQYSQDWILESLLESPLTCKTAAIGKKTAQLLEEYDLSVDIQPTHDYNSESLLALPALQSVNVYNKNLLIIKGKGGRTLLADTLETRGANIQTVSVYRRGLPTPEDPMLLTLHSEKVDIIALTSVESSDNLFKILKRHHVSWLSDATLLLGSSRIQGAIKKKGMKNLCLIAENPTDDKMYAALLKM